MKNRSFINSVVGAGLAMAVIGMSLPAFAADATRATNAPGLTLPLVPEIAQAVVRQGMSARARAIFMQLAAENPGIEGRSLPPAGTLIFSAKPARMLPVSN